MRVLSQRSEFTVGRGVRGRAETLQSKPAVKIDPALVEAVKTLRNNPALAEQQLREIWKSQPRELNSNNRVSSNNRAITGS
jgi:hypothetical protein